MRAAGQTRYLIIVGPEMDAYSIDTPFAPGRGAGFHHITDGTSNSILVLETDSPVPWTKPDDLQCTKGEPRPRVISPHAGGSHALFADGTPKFIKSTIDPNILSAILTINGGDVTSWA
jgi:prepilin-type processing-associated H-X9-DG protein